MPVDTKLIIQTVQSTESAVVGSDFLTRIFELKPDEKSAFLNSIEDDPRFASVVPLLRASISIEFVAKAKEILSKLGWMRENSKSRNVKAVVGGKSINLGDVLARLEKGETVHLQTLSQNYHDLGGWSWDEKGPAAAVNSLSDLCDWWDITGREIYGNR